MTPETMVDDSPIETGSYRPSNAGGRYRGRISLREAFARSSNVVAVKLYRQLGSDAIEDAARSLGVERDFPDNASVALGSGEMTLLELTGAYAAIAGDGRAVEPHALPGEEKGFFDRLFDSRPRVNSRRREQMRELLAQAINNGTGGAARLAIPTFGKTGTTQDSRDALFVGFAGDLVVGVWIGNDNNTPLGSASGGGVPARMWRDFMSSAIPGAAPRPRSRPEPEPEEVDAETPAIKLEEDGSISIDTDIGGGRLSVDGEGGVVIEPDEPTRRRLEELENLGNQPQRPPENENPAR